MRHLEVLVESIEKLRASILPHEFDHVESDEAKNFAALSVMSLDMALQYMRLAAMKEKEQLEANRVLTKFREDMAELERKASDRLPKYEAAIEKIREDTEYLKARAQELNPKED